MNINRLPILPAALACLLSGASHALARDSIATGITHYYDFDHTVPKLPASGQFTIKNQTWNGSEWTVQEEECALIAHGDNIGTCNEDKPGFGHCLSGGGTKARIQGCNAPFLSLPGENGTISFWALRVSQQTQPRLLVNGTPIGNYGEGDLKKALDGNTNIGYGFYRLSNNKIGVRLSEKTIEGTTTNHTLKTIVSKTAFSWNGTKNSWHHILLVRNGTTLTLYVDNKNEGEAAMTAGSSIDAPENGLWTTLSKETPMYANNGVDDLAIWNRALSAQEITKIATSGKPISRLALPENIAWQNGDGLWSDGTHWDLGAWLDNVPAVFPDSGGTVTVGVDTNAAVPSIAFNGDYTLTNANGSITLSGPVTVAAGKTAAILTKISGALTKNGSGTIVVDPGLTQADSYSFSGPATVQNGQLSQPVTLAADAALTLSGAGLQKALAGNGASLALAGTNTLGAAIGGFSSTAFAAGSLTLIAGDVAFGGLGTVTVEAGSALAVAGNANLTYDFALGASLPAFTELNGTVKVTGVLETEKIQKKTPVEVAKVPAGMDINGKFTGTVKSEAGTDIDVYFSNDGGTVNMRADINPNHLVYTKRPGADEFTWEKNGTGFDGGGVFSIFDNVSFVEDGDAGHRVTVNVGSGVVAGDVTVGPGFAFAGESFIAASLTKTNAGASSLGSLVIAGDVAAAGGTLDAAWLAAGTVAVSNGAALRAARIDRRTMRFLRLTITASVNSGGAAIAELRLFRKTPYGYERIEWPSGTMLSDNSGRTTTYVSGSGTSNPDFDNDEHANQNLSALIDGWYNGANLGSDDYHNKWWVSLPAKVTIEFPNAMQAPDGYNFCSGDSGYNENRSPKNWAVEISANGEKWTTVSAVTNAWAGTPAWYRGNDNIGGPDAPAFLLNSPAAADVSAVTVADGGTLVADGDWTARLTLAAGATLKAETNSCLLLHADDPASSAQINAGLTVDLTAYASTIAGNRYILEGRATNWPAPGDLTVNGKAADQTFGGDDGGYYVGIEPRTLAWGPAADDTERLWMAGFGQTPWKAADAQTFFRDNDNVTFGQNGGGGEVNVSGTVLAASAVFDTGAAYLLQPAEGAAAKIVLPADKRLTVNGILTNRVAAIRPGLAIGDGGRLVQEAGGAHTETTDIGAAGTLVLAPAANETQTFSGKISGQGNIVKDGEGTTRITSEIASAGTLAVNAGKLIINAKNQSIAATGDNPIFVGPGAALRFDGSGQTLLPWNAWLLCDGGRVELNGTNPFPGGDLPVFTLTNRATLVADCSTGQGHLHLKTVNLDGSDILIAGGTKAFNDEGLTAANMTVAGACGISYAPGAAQNMLKIDQGGKIDIAAGGSLLFAVKAGKDDFTKTGPGTLIATNGAAFLSALTVNEGALKLPQEAGTFEKAVTFTNNAVIDVSARTEPYAWGTNLTVQAGYTVKVDVSGRTLKTGDRLLTWDAKPAGDFQLIGANLSVTKGDKALEVTSGGMVLILR